MPSGARPFVCIGRLPIQGLFATETYRSSRCIDERWAVLRDTARGALGNDSGSYFADCYPELVVGAAAGRSLTFGYLLGQNLA